MVYCSSLVVFAIHPVDCRSRFIALVSGIIIQTHYKVATAKKTPTAVCDNWWIWRVEGCEWNLVWCHGCYWITHIIRTIIAVCSNNRHRHPPHRYHMRCVLSETRVEHRTIRKYPFHPFYMADAWIEVIYLITH